MARLGFTTEAVRHGGKIREVRDRSGIIRREAAERLGMSYQRLADIELDRNVVSLELVLRIAEAIGCDPHEIDPRLASTQKGRRRAPSKPIAEANPS